MDAPSRILLGSPNREKYFYNDRSTYITITTLFWLVVVASEILWRGTSFQQNFSTEKVRGFSRWARRYICCAYSTILISIVSSQKMMLGGVGNSRNIGQEFPDPTVGVPLILIWSLFKKRWCAFRNLDISTGLGCARAMRPINSSLSLVLHVLNTIILHNGTYAGHLMVIHHHANTIDQNSTNGLNQHDSWRYHHDC